MATSSSSSTWVTWAGQHMSSLQPDVVDGGLHQRQNSPHVAVSRLLRVLLRKFDWLA